MIRKIIFEGCARFKFKNLGLALGTTLKFHNSVEKELKLKVKKYLRLSHMFVEIMEKKLVDFYLFPRIKTAYLRKEFSSSATFISVIFSQFYVWSKVSFNREKSFNFHPGNFPVFHKTGIKVDEKVFTSSFIKNTVTVFYFLRF